MMQRVIPIALALAFAFFVGGVSAADQLSVDISGVPNFVFADDRIGLFVDVGSETEPPKGASPSATVSRPVTVQFEMGGEASTMNVNVPIHNHLSATAHVEFDASQYTSGDVIHCLARGERFKDASAQLVVKDATSDLSDLRVAFDHLEDSNGRRAIVRIPRPTESAHRRWLPLRVAQGQGGVQGGMYLYGVHLGDHHYAKEFKREVDRRGLTGGSALTATNEVSVFRLLGLVDSVQGQSSGYSVYIFPGNADVEQGTPISDYTMALHAMVAAFAAKNPSPAQIILCTPYASGEPERTRAYADAVRQVAREWHVGVADLSDIRPRETSVGIVSRVPDDETQERFVERMLATSATPSALLIVYMPAVVFSGLSGALLWLCLASRYRRAG